MRTVHTIEELRHIVGLWKEKNASVGLVPTMGFLHEGHESLMRRAAEDNDRVVVSIFVNPAQFGPSEDLDRYPRDMEHDLERCEALGVDLVFCPEVEEMYPTGFQTKVSVDGLSLELCGKSRPTHFQGVCTVVGKLFTIVGADRAYFGQKDAQQLIIIRRMVRDLNFMVEIVACPTVREPDGLAKSSRNKLLTPEERKAAPALNRALQLAEDAVAAGARDSATLRRLMENHLSAEPLLRVDYLEIVDALSLQPVQKLSGSTLIAAAIFLEKTRIIDNRLIEPA
jgi:pantoate--beta-alanine ligase